MNGQDETWCPESGGYFSMKCNGINQGNCDLTRGNGTLGGIKPHALGLKISF